VLRALTGEKEGNPDAPVSFDMTGSDCIDGRPAQVSGERVAELAACGSHYGQTVREM
jgi:hypothetical protein